MYNLEDRVRRYTANDFRPEGDLSKKATYDESYFADNVVIDSGTDDNGNKIQTAILNSPEYNEAMQEKAQPTQSVFSNLADAVSTAWDNFASSSIDGLPSNVLDTSEIDAYVDRKAENEFHPIDFVKNAIHESQYGTEIEHSKLYESYFRNRDDRNAEVARIANTLKISEDTFAHDQALYQKAAEAADMVEKLKENKQFLDENGKVDMNKIYASVPGLLEVQQKYGSSAAALALSNMEGLKSINDVYTNAAQQFLGSVWAGFERGVYTLGKNMRYTKAALFAEDLSDEDKKAVESYNKSLAAIPKYSFDSTAGAVGGMIGLAAENIVGFAPAQVAAGGASLAVGAGVYKLTHNAKAATKAATATRNIIGTLGIAAPILGQEYEEDTGKVDEYGRRVYTNEQARGMDIIKAIFQGALEQWTLSDIGNAILGRKQAVSKAVADVISRSETEEAAKEGVRAVVLDRLKDMAAAGGKSFMSESREEFLQQASDMIVENAFQAGIYGKDADISSVSDILTQSTAAMIDAAPTILGFGIIGGVGNVAANTRGAISLRERAGTYLNNRIYRSSVDSTHLADTIVGVQNNMENIKELKSKAPEAATEILDQQNARMGIEETAVDVKSLAQADSGLVQEIAKKAGISDGELAIAMADESSGKIVVKTSTLMQMDMSEEQQKALHDNVSKTADAFTLKEINEKREDARKAMKELAAKAEDDYANVDKFVNERFADVDDGTRDLVRNIIFESNGNPARTYSERLRNTQQRIDTLLNDAKEYLKSGMGKGVDIIATDEDGTPLENQKAVAGGYVRVSNNAEWYREYFAENGKAPTARELEDIAIAMVTGEDNPYVPEEMRPQSEQMENDMKNSPEAKELKDLLATREKLESIGDKMKAIKPGEVELMSDLTDDGRKVYSVVMNELMSGNKEVKKEALVGAILTARMAERIIDFHHEAGDTAYNADDFLNSRVLHANAELENELALKQAEKNPVDNGQGKADNENEKVRRLIERARNLAKIDRTKYMVDIRTGAIRRHKFQKTHSDWNTNRIRLDRNGGFSIDRLWEIGEAEDLNERVNRREAELASVDVHLIEDNAYSVYSYLMGETNRNNLERDITEENINDRYLDCLIKYNRIIASSLETDEGLSADEKERKEDHIIKQLIVLKGAMDYVEGIAKRKGYHDTRGNNRDNYERNRRLQQQDTRTTDGGVIRESRTNDELLSNNEQSNTQAEKHSDNNRGAFSIGKKLTQSMTATDSTQTVRGQYGVSELGQHVIDLFNSADESTFMHETAHMYYGMLEELAAAYPESSAAKELAIVNEWAEWREGQAAEYKGTRSAQEFQAREDAIKDAIKKGDKEKEKTLRYEWAQERFARGFETYLESGEAPAVGLKRVFRSLRKWLTRVYRDVIGAGAMPSSEVKAVMDRMIASDEEIKMMDALRSAEELEKLDPDIMETDIAKLHEKWKAEALAKAEERMMARLMNDLRKKREDDESRRRKETESKIADDMHQMPCFVGEELVSETGEPESVLTLGYDSVESWEADLEKNGGSYMAEFERRFNEAWGKIQNEFPTDEELQDRAVEAMAGQYDKVNALEETILQRRIAKYNRATGRTGELVREIESEFNDIKKANGDTGKIEKLEGLVTRLKYAKNWTQEERKLVEDIENAIKLEKAKNAGEQKYDKAMDALKAFKAKTVQNQEWVRAMRDEAIGKTKAIRESALATLSALPVSESSKYNMYHGKEMKAAQKAAEALARAMNLNLIQSKDRSEDARAAMDEAMKLRHEQTMYAAMVGASVKIARKLNVIERRIERERAAVAKDKKLTADYRYYFDRLLYAYGFSKNMPKRPDALIDENGAPIMFADWFRQESGDDKANLPPLIVSAMDGGEDVMHYRKLSIVNVMDIDLMAKLLYEMGRHANELISEGVEGKSLDDVEAECLNDNFDNVSYNVSDNKIGKTKGALGTYLTTIIKPETVLGIMGGKKGAYMRYIYNVLFDANEKEQQMKENEAIEYQEIINRHYTKNDLIHFGDKLKGELATPRTSNEALTKENVVAMALNWGNTQNRARLCVGFNLTEGDVEKIFEEYMTKNDWEFVQEMWDHLNHYGDLVSNVMEKERGVPMKRVKAEPFSIKAGDETIEMRGGYYPIAADPEKNANVDEMQELDMNRASGGAMAFGVGLCSTKNRSASNKIARPILLTLDVINRHVNQQIHIASMRLACRDAYKVLNNKEIAKSIQDTWGNETYKMLKHWVENVWQPPTSSSKIERVAGWLRSRTVQAIMAYRVSTALLNASNIAPMIERLGAGGTINALMAFVRHPSKVRRFVLNDSVFMRNRASNMDRDLKRVQESAFHPGNIAQRTLNAIDRYANTLIEETDMMTSVPTYYYVYQDTYNKAIGKGMKEEDARREAHRDAHEAIRSIVGSADTIDQSAVQRDKSEFVRMLTPFYTFSNTMLNAVLEKYYAGKMGARRVLNDDGTISTIRDSAVKRYSGFAKSVLMRFVLMSLIETAIREGMAAASSGAGGGDDKEKWWLKWLKNGVSSATGGFYGLNAIADLTMTAVEGKASYGRTSGGVISGTVDRTYRAVTSVFKLFDGKSRTDIIDAGRDASKAAGAFYGISDTLLDALWNTARFATDNYRFNNPDDLREYIAKSIFDKKLKRKR